MSAQNPDSGDRAVLNNDRITPIYRPEQKTKAAPCQAGCANCGDVRGWIQTVAQRSKTGISRRRAFQLAWQTIAEVNPFPSTLGRICPHPCEARCNRSEKDEALAINAMERFLGDWAIDQELPLVRLSDQRREEWLGVIGAGPSGLSFAYQAARRGYRVTIYEKQAKAGGMLRFGVPDFRLPQDILDAEIERILQLGVELRLNVELGRDITLAQLHDRHTALYLGIGAQSGRTLGVSGEKGASVWTATEYLSILNRGGEVDLGQQVIVIGGGNSAVDAARCARRTGAAVTLLYRRTRQEMPAASHEIDEALNEGVQISYLVAPLSVIREPNGALRELHACRMELGDPDESGRRRPTRVAGSDFSLDCDSIISAISQQPVLDGLKELHHQGNWLIADEGGQVSPGVLAGGDALGLGIAGNAILQGRKGAELLHERLTGEKPEQPSGVDVTIPAQQVDLGSKPESSAAQPPALAVDSRMRMDAAEVVGTISEEQFLNEVERCLSCGLCFGCDKCDMYCTEGCYTRLDSVSPGAHFLMQLDKCHECGKCIEVCPSGFLSER